MRRPKNRLIATATVLVGLGVLLSLGCSLLDRMGGASRPWFNHRFHVKDKKIECVDCHPDAATGDLAGMPAQETCAPCHESMDAKKEPESRAAAFYPEGKPVWKSVARLSPEILFSHKIHVEKGTACADCHKGIEDSEHVDPSLAVRMWACMDCHTQKGVSNDCAVCHRTIRPEVSPESHRLNWELLHGQASKQGTEARRLCRLCHGDDACAGCHNEQKPRNHTEFWRIQGHGSLAAMDRDKCRTCHQVDYCVRCHADTPPRSHVGSWGAPRDNHCMTCHTPLRASENCALCHAGTPSHSEATPKPGDHTAAMNCRQCHGVGQPLPHVDNGMNCNSCHH